MSMGLIVIETLNNFPYIFCWECSIYKNEYIFIGSEAKTSWKFTVIGQKGTLFGEERVEKFGFFLEVCYGTILMV